jgi:hypothetical protein
MRARYSLLAAAAMLLAVPAAVRAQDDCDPDYDDCGYYYDDRLPTGNFFGGSFTVARPQGEFRDNNVDNGLGGDLHYIRALDPDGVLSLRVDAGLAIYGYDRFTVEDGYGYLTDASTSNNVAWIGVGPQIGVPDGRLRPYVNGYAGYSFLWTTTTFDDSNGYYYGDDYYDDDTSFTELDDWSFSYGAGAGVYIPVRRGASPVSIDLGVRYHNNGEAEYLREGDIIENSDGSVSLFPSRSDTDLLTFHFGFSVGIGR